MIEEAISSSSYYHVSEKDFGNKVRFLPRIPISAASNERKIKRICVSPSIAGCMVALGGLLEFPLYVYKTKGDVDVYGAGSSVVDWKATLEHWIVEPTVFYRVGEITEHDLGSDLYYELMSLNCGLKEEVPKQRKLRDKIEKMLKQRRTLQESEDQDIDDTEEDNIPSVLAPMNFDIRYSKNRKK